MVDSFREKDLAAILCAGVGFAMNMNYTSDGSGPGGNSQPWGTFGYTSHEIQRDEDSNFFQKIRSNLIEAKPIFIGRPDHAYNMDGYNSYNEYHINYGWGFSNSQNWYALESNEVGEIIAAKIDILPIRNPGTITGYSSLCSNDGDSKKILIYVKDSDTNKIIRRFTPKDDCRFNFKCRLEHTILISINCMMM